MRSRTVRDFNVPTDIWKFVDQWAETESFELTDDGPKRVYKKEFGALTPTAFVEIGEADGNVHFEAWLKNRPLSRAIKLFTNPDEMGIESNGSKHAVVARNVARDRVNRLLIKLGQPLIS
jgi:hypothetical protein